MGRSATGGLVDAKTGALPGKGGNKFKVDGPALCRRVLLLPVSQEYNKKRAADMLNAEKIPRFIDCNLI
jgi:hypothetical protein